MRSTERLSIKEKITTVINNKTKTRQRRQGAGCIHDETITMMLNPAANGSDGPPLPIPDADAEDLLREAGGGVGVVLVTGHRGVKRSQKRGPITPNRGNKCNTRQGNTKKIQKNKACCAEPWYWIACYQDASCFRSRRATSCQRSPSLIMFLTRFASPRGPGRAPQPLSSQVRP